jgi:hypothetical protein
MLGHRPRRIESTLLDLAVVWSTHVEVMAYVEALDRGGNRSEL